MVLKDNIDWASANTLLNGLAAVINGNDSEKLYKFVDKVRQNTDDPNTLVNKVIEFVKLN